MRVYSFEVGHYRGLWGGPIGVVVAKDKSDARGQVQRLCNSDESVLQLTLIPTSRRGVHKLDRARR